MTHGAFESGEGFMIVVDCGDPVTLGTLVSSARFGEIDERRCSDSVAILNELQLLLRFGGILLLKRYRFFGGREYEVSSGDVGRKRQLLCFHAVPRVGATGHRFLYALLARESVEDWQRQHRCDRTRGLGETERELGIAVANCCRVRGSKSHRVARGELVGKVQRGANFFLANAAAARGIELR